MEVESTLTSDFSYGTNDQVVEVQIAYCNSASTYVLTVGSSTTVEQVKQMAVGHFHSPPASLDSHQFALLHATDRRRLSDESSLAQERVQTGANFVLVERAAGKSPSLRMFLATDQTLTELRRRARAQGLFMNHMTGGPPLEGEIRHITAQLPSQRRVSPPSRCGCNTIEVHGKLLLLRRILLGVAHSSLRLLGDARVTQEAFLAILDKLSRRHRSSMKPASISKLKDMGFSEPKSIIALKCKSSVEEAAEWLAEHDPHEHLPQPPPFADLTDGDDPVVVLMPRFWHFRRLYFVPQPVAYRRLLDRGYDATRAFDALMQAENEEILALQVLETERKHQCDLLYTAPPAHHPIMTSIFGASVVQVSLQKPKVLYALLALCANPNNANLWLSDPDTSGVVNLVLKLFYEERFNVDCYCRDSPC